MKYTSASIHIMEIMTINHSTNSNTIQTLTLSILKIIVYDVPNFVKV